MFVGVSATLSTTICRMCRSTMSTASAARARRSDGSAMAFCAGRAGPAPRHRDDHPHPGSGSGTRPWPSGRCTARPDLRLEPRRQGKSRPGQAASSRPEAEPQPRFIQWRASPAGQRQAAGRQAPGPAQARRRHRRRRPGPQAHLRRQLDERTRQAPGLSEITSRIEKARRKRRAFLFAADPSGSSPHHHARVRPAHPFPAVTKKIAGTSPAMMRKSGNG